MARQVIKQALMDLNLPLSTIEHPPMRNLISSLDPRLPIPTEKELRVLQPKPKILLLLSGSVAAVKGPELAIVLSEFAELQIVMTKSASYFFKKSKAYNEHMWGKFEKISPFIKLHYDEHEWEQWEKVGDPILHIQMREWADLVVFAPLSANTMAKLANGLCDNLVTSIARAWDPSKPFLIAPAMNTQMWNHPCTNKQLTNLQSYGYKLIPPVSKTLACGDKGIGALAPIEIIVLQVKECISTAQ